MEGQTVTLHLQRFEGAEVPGSTGPQTQAHQRFEGGEVLGSTQAKTQSQQGFEGGEVLGSTDFINDKQIAQLAYTFTTASRVSDKVRAWNSLLLQAFEGAHLISSNQAETLTQQQFEGAQVPGSTTRDFSPSQSIHLNPRGFNPQE